MVLGNPSTDSFALRGRRLGKRMKALGQRARRSTHPGLDGLDLKIAEYVDFEGGFYVEAGANDGYAQSNTFHLERQRGWSGVLVEAIPELADKCARRRPRSSVVNCALVADDFTEKTIPVRYAGLMSLVDGAQGDADAERRHVLDGLAVQGLTQTYTVEVVARTLTSVLVEHSAPPVIDLLSLDVEGYELNVLRGLDFARFRPRIMVIEARLSVHDLLYIDTRGFDGTTPGA